MDPPHFSIHLASLTFALETHVDRVIKCGYRLAKPVECRIHRLACRHHVFPVPAKIPNHHIRPLV